MSRNWTCAYAQLIGIHATPGLPTMKNLEMEHALGALKNVQRFLRLHVHVCVIRNSALACVLYFLVAVTSVLFWWLPGTQQT